MNIAVLGTGMVGETIGTALLAQGHHICLGSRSPQLAKSVAWVEKNGPSARQGTFAEAAAFGELIINATKGRYALEALSLAGDTHLNDKILIDVSNPLDESTGMPPALIAELSNQNSLGEEIQRKFPKALVVKTLNTMWCGLMVQPQLIEHGDHVNFVCGNNEEAKLKVKEFLVVNFAWRKENLIDLGDISASRGMEGYLPLWLRIYMATKNEAFNIKLIY